MRREKDDWTFLWRVTGPGGAWAAIVASKGSIGAERIARRLGGADGTAELLGVAAVGISPGEVILTNGLEPEHKDGERRDST